MYPGRDITNIVESSHYQKIGGWCRQGALNSAKCKGAQRWVKPFRCLGKLTIIFKNYSTTILQDLGKTTVVFKTFTENYCEKIFLFQKQFNSQIAFGTIEQKHLLSLRKFCKQNDVTMWSVSLVHDEIISRWNNWKCSCTTHIHRDCANWNWMLLTQFWRRLFASFILRNVNGFACCPRFVRQQLNSSHNISKRESKWSDLFFEKYQVCLISSLKSSRRYRNYSIIYLRSVSLSCAHVRPYKSATESLENYSLNHVKFNLVATLAPIQSRRCIGMQQEIAIFSSKVQFEYIVSKVAYTSVNTFLHSFAKQLYNLISYSIETKEKAPMKKEHAHTHREKNPKKSWCCSCFVEKRSI